MFTERKDVAGVPSACTGRARKVFEPSLMLRWVSGYGQMGPVLATSGRR
jgi:hypothetical protein